MARRYLRASVPGIVEVAERAGVSPATVSRCFNTPTIVRFETRKKVEEAAEALGYVPHATARALNHGLSGTVGLIVPTIDNAIFSEMVQAFSDTLSRHARTMLICAHGYDLKRETVLVESLLAHDVDALALVGVKHDEATLQLLERQPVPTAFVWNYRQRQPFPCLGVDNRDAGRLATEHLLERGHTEILFQFAEANANDRAADRRSGALAAAKAAGSSGVDPSRVLTCKYDVDAAKALVLDALERDPKITAVLSGNDVMALGAVFAAAARGMRVPDDLSIVGVGDFKGSSAVEPGLTTVRIPAKRIGRHAAEMLIEMIEWPSVEQSGERFAPELVLRGSTAAVH
ncbi:MAG: LacI family DNA-binding transcriptional regulator [Pseudomonadota bacterium]